MRLETTAGHLRSALRSMRGIVSRVPGCPALSCVRLAADGLTGTDLDNSVTVALPALAPCEGEAVIDYFALDVIASNTEPDEQMTLTSEDGAATITFNGSSYRLASLAPDSFYRLDVTDGPQTRTGNLDLLAAIRRVRFCTSTEETRYYLNGVALLTGPKGPIAAASDGCRLATIPIAQMPDGAAGAIIPNRAVAWLANRKGEPETVTFTEHKARFEFPGISFSAKLVGMSFPDIFRIISPEVSPVFAVSRLQLLAAIRRLALFRSLSSSGAGVKLESTEQGLVCSITMKEGEATERVDWVMPPVEPFSCGYNVASLCEVLTHLRGDVVTFSASRATELVDRKFNLDSAPVEISSEGDLLKIVHMPMRVE